MSSNTLSKHIEYIRPLTEDERTNAKNKAKSFVAGTKPVSQKIKIVQKYPSYIVHIIRGMCIVVLVAAFFISAARIGAAGFDAFYHGKPDEFLSHGAGLMTMLLAEFGLMASVLALSTNTSIQSKRFLWSGAAISMSIAVVGNISQAKLADIDFVTYPFRYLDAVAPSALALIMAYILKQQFLDSVEQQHKVETEYNANLSAWQNTYDNAESNEKWPEQYAIALKEVLYRVNNRTKVGREHLPHLTHDDWRFLVNRERTANEWYNQPISVPVVSEQPIREDEGYLLPNFNVDQEPQQEIVTSKIIRDYVYKDDLAFGHTDLKDNGIRYAACDIPGCNWTGENYTDKSRAEKALHRHYSAKHAKDGDSNLLDYRLDR